MSPRGLERDLLGAGCTVVRVPTNLMAAVRRGGRQPGKSDPIDAVAVAHACLREPGLPAARLDGPVREVKLLSDHSRHLVTERTILCNRLRWHLHELDRALQIPSRGLYHNFVATNFARPPRGVRTRGLGCPLAPHDRAGDAGRCRPPRCCRPTASIGCVAANRHQAADHPPVHRGRPRGPARGVVRSRGDEARPQQGLRPGAKPGQAH